MLYLCTMDTIGQRLKILHIKSGLSQEEYATRIGTSSSQLSKYFNNKVDPPLRTLMKIAKQAGCTVGYLLGETELAADPPAPYTTGAIPYYTIPVTAGSISAYLNNGDPERKVYIPGVKGVAAFDVVGSSMKGEINDGSFIVVDRIDSYERVDPVKLYMVVTRDDRMAKRLYYDPARPEVVTAISNNYPNFTIFVNEILELYRIVFIGERL